MAREDPSIFVRDYSLWEVRPDEFSNDTFPVLCGNEIIHSQILTEEGAERLREDLPERTVLIQVPVDLRSVFESDLEGSIRDMAGVATVAISPFIQRVGQIRAIADDREHPFSVDLFDPSHGGSFVPGRMVRTIRERSYDGKQIEVSRPILNPRAPRHIHIDPALKGCAAGFCMSHIGGWVEVERHTQGSDKYSVSAPIFVVDFVLKIVPPTGGELDFGIYEALVFQLISMGYPVKTVTADQWQSTYVLQRLAKKGLHVDKISMDRTWEPYQHMKLAIYEGRVHCYYYAPLFQELQSLEADWNKRKVLKPSNGSKDVADSLAGSLYSLVHMRTADPLPMMKGLSYFGDPSTMSLGLQAVGGLVPMTGSGNAPMIDGQSILPPFLTSSSGWNNEDW
jgi:hypothetical protein